MNFLNKFSLLIIFLSVATSSFSQDHENNTEPKVAADATTFQKFVTAKEEKLRAFVVSTKKILNEAKEKAQQKFSSLKQWAVSNKLFALGIGCSISVVSSIAFQLWNRIMTEKDIQSTAPVITLAIPEKNPLTIPASEESSEQLKNSFPIVKLAVGLGFLIVLIKLVRG